MFFFRLTIVIFLTCVSIGSCKQSYQKVLKSNDLDYKYEMAKKYYNKKDYYKALPLFEELMNIYKGTKNIEKIQKLGAGEIIVTSIDHEGKKNLEDLAWNSAAIIPGAGQAAQA